MNLRILLCGAASLSVFRLVSARPQIPAPPPTGQCVVQEAVNYSTSLYLFIVSIINYIGRAVPISERAPQWRAEMRRWFWSRHLVTVGTFSYPRFSPRLAYSHSLANAGENCRVGQMPCSSQYNFFCVNENTGCFAAQNLHTYPTYTGEKLGFVLPEVCGSFL